jgi:hypothetical protein
MAKGKSGRVSLFLVTHCRIIADSHFLLRWLSAKEASSKRHYCFGAAEQVQVALLCLWFLDPLKKEGCHIIRMRHVAECQQGKVGVGILITCSLHAANASEAWHATT